MNPTYDVCKFSVKVQLKILYIYENTCWKNNTFINCDIGPDNDKIKYEYKLYM